VRDRGRLFIAAGILLAALTLTAAAPPAVADGGPAEGPRQEAVINRDWRFTLGDPPSAAAPGTDDVGWQRVDLPHSFSEPYFLSPDFYQGVGWYRKHLPLPADAAGRRVCLEFDGAYRAATVFLNGRPVGRHPGGYTGFSIDVTDAARPGADNVLAVRLDNRWNARLAPRSGDHLFSGGIYRDVRLVITDPLHVAWYGTAVRTVTATDATATLTVETELANDGSGPVRAAVQTDVIDRTGTVVATARSDPQAIGGSRSATVSQAIGPIAHPSLWSPRAPTMYSLRTTVFNGDRPADAYRTEFGIRTVQFTADRGFFINGQHLYFTGANVHQDHAGWGDAATDAGAARDVRLVHDAGFNFIRGSHYPHSPAFADACDRLGVLFWSENDFWGSGGRGEGNYRDAGAYPTGVDDQAPFEQSVLDDLRDMIRVHRNHPSIIVWSTGNEDFFTAKPTLPRVRDLLKKEVALAHALDPTRPVGIGGCQRGDLDTIGDVAGYNGDGARLFLHPAVPSVVTEYGSVYTTRPGKYDPGWGDLPRGAGKPDDDHPYPWRYPWRSGESLWCAFDHGTQFGPRLGQMGIVDYFRIPKRAWYWYRNAYAHVPPPAWPAPGTPAGLRLTADKTTIEHADGTDDVQLTVTVVDGAGRAISNSPPVELTVISGPGELPTGPSLHFAEGTDIPIADGTAAIEMRAYSAGPTVVRATSPGLAPAELTIACAGGPPFVPGTTPMAVAQPYVRFVTPGRRVAKRAGHGDGSLGRDNPTFATTEAPGHAANLANDGDAATYWQADANDRHPAWTVDLERAAALVSVHIVFPTPAVRHFAVETSDDRNAWRPAADPVRDDAAVAVRDVSLAPATKGRFVRIAFTDVPAGGASISELEARGSLAGP
jgi:hypothetical protein